jgi:hypothetical protein
LIKQHINQLIKSLYRKVLANYDPGAQRIQTQSGFQANTRAKPQVKFSAYFRAKPVVKFTP